MNAYDRQLQSAIEHLDNMNPMFDFSAADRPTQARQLKTWWGRALADDHINGHDPSGPVAADNLTDRQAVLLSALQRGARGRIGDWTATAAPAHSDGLTLTVSGNGVTITARTAEGKSGVCFPDGISAADTDGNNLRWPASMHYRTTHLSDPVIELIDILALSAAFAGSPFAAQADSFRRISPETLEVEGREINLDWQELTATTDRDVADDLAYAAGIAGEDVPAALAGVLRAAVENGHSVPDAPTKRTMPEVSQPSAGVVNDGAAILAGLGIDVGDATVIGIPPGGSMSIGIGVGTDGSLSVSGLPAAGAAPFVDPEEAFMAECAKSIGIPLETFRDIVTSTEEGANT